MSKSLKAFFGNIAFFVAQMHRFVPAGYHPLFDRTLQMWCRWPPLPRRRAFKGGLGYFLVPHTNCLAYIAGSHEAAYLQVIHRHLRDGSVVFDIGANAGTSILWLHFAKPLRKLSFVAIEAMPDTAEILRANMALNPSVDCINVCNALAETEGKLEFGTAGAGDGSARVAYDINTNDWSKRNRVQVNATTLDSLVFTTERKPTFLLIDVEGFAGAVLAGGLATIESMTPDVGLEIHSDKESAESEAILVQRGYRMIWESRRYGLHRIYSCQSELLGGVLLGVARNAK